MKNVYLFQFSIVNENKFVLLPYSAGLIQAYSQSIDQINEQFTFPEDIIFIPENEETFLSKIKNPSIVGFSIYLWNLSYTDNIARKIKKKYSNCKIVYGGPQVPDNYYEFLKERPWVDHLIHKEGEISFADYLLNKNTKPTERIKDLKDLPSPYLAGVFDGYKSRHKKYVLNAILETNRGCPYKCTFCDWGGVTYSKIYKFPLERVYKELEWMSTNKIEFITSADANFCIFKERDEKIIDEMIRLKKNSGYPKTFNTSWAKNSNEFVLNMASKLKKESMLRKFNVSLQSLNTTTLHHIKRRNMEFNNLTTLISSAKNKNLDVLVELVLNLPGETKKTWIDNYCKILKMENVYIESYPLTVLNNSELNDEDYKKKHCIKTVKSKTNYGLQLNEQENIVVSTKNMSEKDYSEVCLFTWFLRSMHSMGYLFYIYQFMKDELQIDIKDFYEYIFQNCPNSLKDILKDQKTLLRNNLYNTFYYDNNWIHSIEENRDIFYTEIGQLIKKQYGSKYIDELLEFQNTSLFNSNITYPITKTFNYNFMSMKKEQVNIEFDHPGINTHNDFKSFLSLTRSHDWKCNMEIVKI